MTRANWTHGYVRRARAAGFNVEATADGCVYLPDQECPDSCRMVCVPCDCTDRDDEWHMDAAT